MGELAANSVGAVEVFMILLAELSLILRGNMLFLLEFIFSMCKGATIPKFALAGLLPIFTHLLITY